jgi:hypothetical protein
VGVTRALPVLKTLTRVAAKPSQTGLGVGGQSLAVDLPAAQITGGKVITASHLFGVTFTRAQHEQTKQNNQSSTASIQSIHADISMGCSTESAPSVDYQGTDIAFMTQMATHGHPVVVLLKNQAL